MYTILTIPRRETKATKAGIALGGGIKTEIESLWLGSTNFPFKGKKSKKVVYWEIILYS